MARTMFALFVHISHSTRSAQRNSGLTLLVIITSLTITIICYEKYPQSSVCMQLFVINFVTKNTFI